MHAPLKASEAGPLPHQGQGGKQQWRFFDDFASRYAMKDVFPSSAWARRAELEFGLELAGLAQRFLGRVVDVGAGIAAPARFLQGRYSGYWAVDGSWAMASAAKRFHRHNPRFFAVTADAQALPVREALFDVAFSIGALHHMDDPVQALRCVFRSLKPGGVLVVREPMRTNPLLQILRYLRMLVDRHYSRHQKFFRIGELTAMACSAGFAVEKVAGYGLFSTPFAQVVLRPVAVTLPLSRAAVRLDQWLAKRWPGLSRLLSFNVVLVARRP
ncbi:Demethylrebeccamycin-D-glucose O-methyltransferase [bacterium HR09]|nr:Demethylrebeccamycin-D-glucose O-methyltransferase [bacterium HR09]